MSDLGLNINQLKNFSNQIQNEKKDERIPDKVISLNDFLNGKFDVKPGESFAVVVNDPPIIPNRIFTKIELSENSNLQLLDKVHQSPPLGVCGGGGQTFYVFKAPEEGKIGGKDLIVTNSGSGIPLNLLEKKGDNVELSGGDIVKKVKANTSVSLGLDDEQEKKIPEKVFDLKDIKANGINVKPGEEFAIKVYSNGSTGYSWNCETNGLKLKDQVYKHSDPTFMMAGAGGELYYIFKAPENGESNIKLTHGRSWEQNPIESRDIKVNVGEEDSVKPQQAQAQPNEKPLTDSEINKVLEHLKKLNIQ